VGATKRGGRWLVAAALIGLSGLAAREAAAAGDYLEDALTARAVSLTAPRVPLSEAVAALSEAAGVALSVRPPLAGQSLVGHTPRRSLREIMGALGSLFDGVWKPAGAGYELVPDPAKHAAWNAARAALVKRQLTGLNEAAAEAVRQVQADGVPKERNSRGLGLSLAYVIWSLASATDRSAVLAGKPVTFPIPEARAKLLHPFLSSVGSGASRPVSGPLLATLDLDDRGDEGVPTIRARVTALMSGSAIGAIHPDLELPRQAPAPAPPADANAAGPTLPTDLGQGGAFEGERDDVLLQFAQASGIPVLARNRPYGGNSRLNAGGRRVAEVIAQLATVTDCRIVPDARGFQLLRSQTELTDALGQPDAAAVAAYLAKQPAPPGSVPFAALLPLAQMSPLQISYLSHSALCSANEQSFAGSAGSLYAVLRFYRTLSAEQQSQLFSREGLELSTLAHAQLHELLGGKDKRADLDVSEAVTTLAGSRISIVELDQKPRKLKLQALKGTKVLSEEEADLPVVEAPRRAAAQR
jgi:hypothetical protein